MKKLQITCVKNAAISIGKFNGVLRESLVRKKAKEYWIRKQDKEFNDEYIQEFLEKAKKLSLENPISFDEAMEILIARIKYEKMNKTVAISIDYAEWGEKSEEDKKEIQEIFNLNSINRVNNRQGPLKNDFSKFIKRGRK
ncbi:hypothetical protein VSU16_04625 [Cetobacterium somerae]|uniref:hypothetical protein n=1 Tax=Cetobacterium somerae TaxID=188913 RepID=UPI002E7B9152|nr:hypothetical protein [Cetobacterium somerae]WVJ02028.1 hypothetical protein VSU16_04625 [Cetobacterium somerae]